MTADWRDVALADANDGVNMSAARALAGSLLGDEPLFVFLSPGSRNTPLAIAFDELATRDDVTLRVVLDERVAAFAALGAARATGRPAVLVCTSGSAGGHYLPALMEADRGRVPLIVITADRPAELHHAGAPQTTEQTQLFGSYVRWSATLPTPSPHVEVRHHVRLGLSARAFALGSPPGPVHLNAPFRKPLFDDEAARSARSPRRAPSVTIGRRQLDAEALDALARRLGETEKGVIHVGPHAPATLAAAELAEAVAALGDALGWPVIADGASAIRCEAGPWVQHGEVLARTGIVPNATFALRIGGAPTNRHLDAWLGALPSVLLDPDGCYLDPEGRADTLAVADPASTCRELARRVVTVAPSWAEAWRRAETRAREALADLAPTVAGVAAARAVAKIEGTHLHVASSMAIRDVDAFAVVRRPRALTSNRGLNGIDGTTSTALGIAWASGAPTTVLLGDLAFVHDLGALHAAARAEVTLTLVVVNNDGGSIFEMLPVSEQLARPQFERLFATPQDLDLGSLSLAAGASHQAVGVGEVEAVLASKLSSARGVHVVEVRQGRDDERRARAQMWRELSATLSTKEASP